MLKERRFWGRGMDPAGGVYDGTREGKRIPGGEIRPMCGPGLPIRRSGILNFMQMCPTSVHGFPVAAPLPDFWQSGRVTGRSRKH
jgi:hypothetical protein